MDIRVCFTEVSQVVMLEVPQDATTQTLRELCADAFLAHCTTQMEAEGMHTPPAHDLHLAFDGIPLQDPTERIADLGITADHTLSASWGLHWQEGNVPCRWEGTAIAVSPSGGACVVAHPSGHAHLWNMRENAPQEHISVDPVHDNFKHICAVGNNVAASVSGAIQFFSFEAGLPKDHMEIETTSRCLSLAFACNKLYLFEEASANSTPSARIFAVHNDEVPVEQDELPLHHKTQVSSAVVSQCGRLLCSSAERSNKVWCNEAGVTFELSGHRAVVTSLAVGPGVGTALSLVSGGMDKQVCVWDLATRTLKHTLKGHSGVVRAVSLSPCGSWVLSASRDASVLQWDAEHGGAPHRSFKSSGPVTSLAVSPCSQWAVFSGKAKQVEVVRL